MSKMGVNRAEVPHHAQVWECPPSPPGSLHCVLKVVVKAGFLWVNYLESVSLTQEEMEMMEVNLELQLQFKQNNIFILLCLFIIYLE